MDPQTFAFDHAAQLSAFQVDGDDRFLWGLDRATGETFYLEDDQGHAQREHVTANVVCPVPGCAAALTTVHSTVKRDHLRHLGSAGGHGLESAFHAQGCALIQAWLTEKYPRSTVRREEYTNARGERRADVLITAPTEERIAFEVQYSPLTHDEWAARHDSYERQGIRDVWLFGHTTNHLRLDHHSRLRSNPALAAVAATGVPLLFVNPEMRQVAIATDQLPVFSAALGRDHDERRVTVLGGASGAALEVHSLEEFRLGSPALTSERIDSLVRDAAALVLHNAEQHRLHELALEQERARQAAWEAGALERMEREKQRRIVMATAIRDALRADHTWSADHSAWPKIRAYVDGRRLRDLTVGDFGYSSRLEHWKCVAYFEWVALNEDTFFGPREVAESLRAHGIRLQKGIYRIIGRWLHELEDDGFLLEARGQDGYSVYKPTFRGTWW